MLEFRGYEYERAPSAISGALMTPAAAQYVYTEGYYSAPRGYDEVYVYDGPVYGAPVYGSPTPLLTQRGLLTDPDPHIGNQIQRNYNYYMNLNGG